MSGWLFEEIWLESAVKYAVGSALLSKSIVMGAWPSSHSPLAIISCVYCSAHVLQAVSLITRSSTPQNMEILIVFESSPQPARPIAVPHTMTAERATSEAFLNSFFFILLPLINIESCAALIALLGKRCSQFGGVRSPLPPLGASDA